MYAEHSALLLGQPAHGRAITHVSSIEAGQGTDRHVEILDLRRSEARSFPRPDPAQQASSGLGLRGDLFLAGGTGSGWRYEPWLSCRRQPGTWLCVQRMSFGVGGSEMAKRHPNHRLVKAHRNYTVEEAATVLDVHRNTVSHWTKNGLKSIDAQRPRLIHGSDLAAFLIGRRTAARRPCGPGQMYCLRCRKPVDPAGDMADFIPTTTTLGNLMGICPHCESVIFRKVNTNRLGEVSGRLDVQVKRADQHISQCDQPSLNRAFRKDT
jgi:Helix-turn-helix domain